MYELWRICIMNHRYGDEYSCVRTERERERERESGYTILKNPYVYRRVREVLVYLFTVYALAAVVSKNVRRIITFRISWYGECREF